MQSDEHVADIMSFYLSREEHNVLFTYRSHIEHLQGLALFEILDIQLEQSTAVTRRIR